MISYRINRRDRLVEVVGSGLLDPAGITAIEVRIGSDPAFDPAFALLVDFGQASFANVMPSDTRLHAEVHPFDADSPCAIVMGSDYDDGIIRLFAALTELKGGSRKVRGFRDQESALAWIEKTRAGGVYIER